MKKRKMSQIQIIHSSKNVDSEQFFVKFSCLICLPNRFHLIKYLNFCVDFLYEGAAVTHPAIIGVATMRDGVPLYYDAINEHGLAVAGLNFPISAVYNKKTKGKYNVASYELIPFILSNCRTAEEAKELLKNTTITADGFSAQLGPTPLHWIVADSELCITVEPTENGLEIYDNELRVLTNEPPFL